MPKGLDDHAEPSMSLPCSKSFHGSPSSQSQVHEMLSPTTKSLQRGFGGRYRIWATLDSHNAWPHIKCSDNFPRLKNSLVQHYIFQLIWPRNPFPMFQLLTPQRTASCKNTLGQILALRIITSAFFCMTYEDLRDLALIYLSRLISYLLLPLLPLAILIDSNYSLQMLTLQNAISSAPSSSRAPTYHLSLISNMISGCRGGTFVSDGLLACLSTLSRWALWEHRTQHSPQRVQSSEDT